MQTKKKNREKMENFVVLGVWPIQGGGEKKKTKTK